MSTNPVSETMEEERIIEKANHYETKKSRGEKEPAWKGKTMNIVAKGIIGAAIGVAGGMVLVTAAAAVEGAILSWVVFAKVLGIAGAAGGVSHGMFSNKNKKRN